MTHVYYILVIIEIATRGKFAKPIIMTDNQDQRIVGFPAMHDSKR